MSKISEVELKRLFEIQRDIAEINNKFGQLCFAKALLEKDIEDCKVEYLKIWKKQEDLQSEFTGKYGEGTVDMTTGEFLSSNK